MKFVIINGPNLNMLGIREPDKYGTETYQDLVEKIKKHCEQRQVVCEFYQSNHEGDLVDRIQQAYFDQADGIVINPAAYTHYSYAILDALKAVDLPAVEVHLSNIHKREEFRYKSVTAAGCDGQICGLGQFGYVAAMGYLIEKLSSHAD